MTTLPLGIRNNNPGNLEYTGRNPFLGVENPPHDKQGFYIFKDPEWGIRAVMLDLHSCMEHDHLLTVEDIITHYAPPTENDTASYIKAVLHDCDWDAGHEPDKDDPETYLKMTKAIIVHENGVGPDPTPAWYDDEKYQQAFDLTGIAGKPDSDPFA